jgi:hypothetical protein
MASSPPGTPPGDLAQAPAMVSSPPNTSPGEHAQAPDPSGVTPVLSDAQLSEIVHAVARVTTGHTHQSTRERFPLGTFDGKADDAMRVNPFLARFHAYVELHDITSEREKLILVLKALPATSPAGIWYHHNRAAFSTFADFEDSFRDRFALSHANKQTLLDRFERFRQRDQDDVTRFYTALLSLAEQLALVNEEILPRQLRNKFISGLKPDIKTCVTNTLVTTPAITMNQLVQLAVGFEQNARQLRRTHVSAPTVLRRMHVQARSNVVGRQPSASPSDTSVVCRFCKKTRSHLGRLPTHCSTQA